MDYRDRRLPLVTLAFAIVAAAAWTISRGPTRAQAAEVVRGGVEVEEAREVGPAADLVEVLGGDKPERRAILDPAEPGELVDAAPPDRPACSVEGILLTPHGFPRDGVATIRATPADAAADVAPIASEFPVDETWSFDELAPGRWVFSARAETGEQIAWGRSEEVRLLPEARLEPVRIALVEYVVEGQVVDSRGMPIADLPVAYSWTSTDPHASQSGSFVRIPSTRALGNLSTNIASHITIEVPDGGWIQAGEVESLAQELVSVQQALDVQRIRFQEARLLANDETDAAMPTLGYAAATAALETGLAEVTELRVSGGNWIARGSGVNEYVTTDAAGRFRIALPGPGNVNVAAPSYRSELPEATPRYLPEATSVTVDLADPLAEVSLSVGLAATVQGQITRSDGGSVEGVNVFLRGADHGSTDVETTDATGSFSFRGRAPGTYLFYARCGGENGQDQCAHARFEVREGDLRHLDERLTSSSSLSGTLVDDAGLPVADARVVALGAENPDLRRLGSTDASGRFTIVGMYGCRYRLNVDGRTLLAEAFSDVPAGGAHVQAGTLRVAADAD